MQAVDTERTGRLSFAGLERVLGECEMLPGQAPPDVCDDVLLAVWTTLAQADPCGGSDDTGGGGGDGGRDDSVGYDREEQGKACGVSTETLSALLTGVAARSYGFETTTSSEKYDPVYANPQNAGRTHLSLDRANSRLWGNDEEERGIRSSGPDVFSTMLQCDEHLEDLCEDLSDIFKTNERHRASRQLKEKRADASDQVGERRALVTTEVQGMKVVEVARGSMGAPPIVATPAQVAATTARFEEQIRAKERNIEHLRRAEEVRKSLAHPFEPSMATTSTPRAAAARRKAGDCGGRSSEVVDDESQQPKRADVRTTEERDLDENCTFQPRLFRPLPIPPPRYPSPKNTKSPRGGELGKHLTSSTDEASPRTSSEDRATASWMAQVGRIKAGRKDRLRRLEQRQAIENRTEPLPPSVQQLFCDAGIKMNPQLRTLATAVSETKQGNGHVAKKKCNSNTQKPPSRSVYSSPPRLRLEARLRSRNRLKQERTEEQARKSAEKDARRQKRKQLLARARKRSAALVGLEAALSARQAERGRPSWSDAPVLIVEVEFVRQQWWVLLPLWADTCPRDAVGALAKQQPRTVVGTVAADLESSFRDEMRRVCEQTPAGVGLELEREAVEGGNSDRGGNNPRAVPTVVVLVDVVDEALRDSVVSSIDKEETSRR